MNYLIFTLQPSLTLEYIQPDQLVLLAKLNFILRYRKFIKTLCLNRKIEIQVVNSSRWHPVYTPIPYHLPSPISKELFVLSYNETAKTHLFDDVFNNAIQCFSFFTTFMTRNSNETGAVALGMARSIALAHKIIYSRSPGIKIS